MYTSEENKRIKVTFIFPGPYPKGKVTPRRAHLLAKGLVQNDVNVLMLVTEATENKDNILNSTSFGTYEGVKYEYIGGTTVRDLRFFQRQIRKIVNHFSLLFYLLTNKYETDIYILLGCSFDYRLLIPMILKFKKPKVILEINEFPLVTKKNLIVHLKRWILFHLIFPLYDGFIPISRNLENVILKHKSHSAKLLVIPIIGAEPNLKLTDSYIRPLSEEYIFHAGSLIEQKDGILGLLEAFGIASKELDIPVKYVFTGVLENSPNKVEIQNAIVKYELDRKVVFTGYLSDNELDLYLRYASLAIINKQRNLQNEYCFASKIAEYTANEIPVILTNVGDIGLYFKDGINSIIVNGGKPQELAQAILTIFQNMGKDIKIGMQGRQIFNSYFNYRVQGERFKRFLIEMSD